MTSQMTRFRTRWAAIGAAVAVTLGAGGGLGIARAVQSDGERAVFVPVTPCRIADTRPAPDNIGARVGPVGAGETVTFDAHGSNGDCTLPVDAVGLSMNITAVQATSPTNLRFFPADAALPTASSLNPSPGVARSVNAVITDLSPDGRFNVFNASGTVEVIMDVNGFFVDHDHDDRYYTEVEVDGLLDEVETGLQGPPGEKGETGPPGADGADGTDLFDRTVVVSGGGTPTENGAAYEAAVAAVAAETPSADDPWRILLDAGLFEVATTVTVPAFVRVEGAGRGTTVLRCASVSCVTLASGNAATFANLTADTIAADSTSVVADFDADVRLEHVHLRNGQANGRTLRVTAGVTTIDSSLIEQTSSASKTAVLVDSAELVLVDSELRGPQSRIDYTNATLSLVRSTTSVIQATGGTNDVRVEHSTVDGRIASPSTTKFFPVVFLSGSTNTLSVSASELVSGGTRAVSVVGTSTAAVEVRHSHVVGNLDGGGDFVVVNSSIDGDLVVTDSETCVGVADLGAGAWLDATCP